MIEKSNIERIVIWSNPAFDLKYRADVEIDTGKIFYKTNAIPNNLKMKTANSFYESFFVVPKSRIEVFVTKLNILDSWQLLYEPWKDGITLDGFCWEIEVIGDYKKQFKGINRKPDDFDGFIAAVEDLLQKNFSYESTVSDKYGQR